MKALALSRLSGVCALVVFTGCFTGESELVPGGSLPVRISVAADSSEIVAGSSVQLTAHVSNAETAEVTWSVVEGARGGTITERGLYTAPLHSGAYNVSAQSKQYASATGTFELRVRPLPPTFSANNPAQGTALTFTVHGNAEPNGQVELFTTENCSDGAVATGTADEQGRFAIEATGAENATVTLFGRVIGFEAMTSSCSTTGVAYRNDGEAPGAPVLASITPGPVANNNSPMVAGTAEANALVQIFPTNDCSGSPIASSPANAQGAFLFTVNVADDTAYTFHARAQDRAGNVSVCSSTYLSYREDSTAPVDPTFVSTTPVSPSRLTTMPLLNGTGEPDALVYFFSTAGCTGPALGYVSVNGMGDFSYLATVTANTTTTVYAHSVDAALNTSACASIPFQHDDIPPNPPIVLTTSPVSPASDNSPVIGGTAEALSTVSLYPGSTCSGMPVASGSANMLGNFSITVTVADNSSNTFYARATDAAGNISNCSPTFVIYNEDSDGPVVSISLPTGPTALRVTNDVLALASDTNGMDRVEFYLDGAVTPFASIDAPGPYATTMDTTLLTDGSHTLLARAFDTLGASSDASYLFVADNTAPLLDTSASRPTNGQRIGVAGVATTIAPARFVFDERDLDEAAVVVNLSWDSFPLVENTHYTVDRSTDNTIEIAVDTSTLPTPDRNGDPLVFSLSNIRDTADTNQTAGIQPNVGADVTLTVTVDLMRPQARWLRPPVGRNARAIIQWDESMATATASTFSFRRRGDSADVVADPNNGRGWLTLGVNPDDTYYFVPDELLDLAGTYDIDVDSMTDLAGNPSEWATGQVTTDFFVPGHVRTLGLTQVDYRPRGTSSATTTVTGSALGGLGWRAPDATANTDNDVVLVFDREIVPSSLTARLSWVSGPENCFVTGQLVSEGGINNAVLFNAVNGAGASPCDPFPWRRREHYEVTLRGTVAGTGDGERFERTWRVAVPGPSEIDSPTATLNAGTRDGATPVIRPEGALYLTLSEPIDVSNLSSTNFTLTGPTTNVPLDVAVAPAPSESTVILRPRSALAAGSYTLNYSTLLDLAAAANPVSGSATFEVVPGPATAPSVIEVMPADLTSGYQTEFPITVAFSDAMSADSFTDRGPRRGFRLEEFMGGFYIPLKGLEAQPTERLADGQVMRLVRRADVIGDMLLPNTTYRFTVLEPANVDGTRVTLPPDPATRIRLFTTAQVAEGATDRPVLLRSSISTRQSANTLFTTQMNVRGQVLDSNLGGTEAWSIRLEREFNPPAEFNSTPSTNPLVDELIAAADVGPGATVGTPGNLLAEGITSYLRLTVEDDNGNNSETVAGVYAYLNQTLVDAAPISVGSGGAYTFNGVVNYAGDADATAFVQVSVLEVQIGSDIVQRVAYSTYAAVTRQPDGTLFYAATIDLDDALSPPASGNNYRAIATLVAPNTVGRGDATRGISAVLPLTY